MKTLTPSDRNINILTLKQIMGTAENKCPRYQGLHAQVEFESQRAKRLQSLGKTTFSPQRRVEAFLKNSGYRVIHKKNDKIFSKSPAEKLELKKAKRTWKYEQKQKEAAKNQIQKVEGLQQSY
jgi:hypothetical protein